MILQLSFELRYFFPDNLPISHHFPRKPGGHRHTSLPSIIIPLPIIVTPPFMQRFFVAESSKFLLQIFRN